MVHSRSSLSGLRDTRGAILALGLALGVVLALGVKTLADVGCAILDRELAQSAADAAAFESATWHARGMNVVATLNVALALVLGVLVIWRLATFAVGLACLLEVAASLHGPSTRALEITELRSFAKLLDEDAQVAGSVVLVGSALRVAQTAVAAYTPVLAAHASALDTKEAFGVASGTFSASLLPSNGESHVKSLAACVGKAAIAPGRGTPPLESLQRRADDDVTRVLALAESGPKLSGASTRLGMPFSLPVEAGDSWVACRQATRRAREEESSPLFEVASRLSEAKARAVRDLGLARQGETLLELSQALSGFFDQGAPSVFCAPAGSHVEALSRSMWGLALGLSGSTSDPATRAVLERRAGRSVSEATEPRSLDEARIVWRVWQRALEAGHNPESCIRSAQVWAPARNGNGYFRTASASARFAGENAWRDVPSEEASPWVVAHAEAFFDCADVWSNCRATALWEPNWRARLRRVRSFRALLDPSPSGVGTGAVDQRAIADWLDRAARQLGGVRRAPDTLDARRELESEPAIVGKTWLYRKLESALREAPESQRPLAALVARHANESSVVH